jgi:hypothetical protein
MVGMSSAHTSMQAEQSRVPRLVIFGAMVSAVLVIALVAVGLRWTSALFTTTQPAIEVLGAADIFRDERDTVAFQVNDVSSGSGVDTSYSLAFSGDSRYFTTWVWPSAFDTSRYIELDLNSPLPAGLSVSSMSLAVRASASAGGATTCYYVEVRRISTGALVSTHGSSGSPLDCITGTTFQATSTSLSAVTTTDLANDLRVRIYARDSAVGAARLDRVVVTGSTPYSSWTLYPILTRDRHDGQSDVIRWGLAGL